MTPELSRPVAVDHVGEGMLVVVEATEAECVAVAARMGIVALHRLSCSFDLGRAEGGVVPASGTLRAKVTQTCVVSLENFDSVIEEDFVVRFVPEGTENDELDLEGDDEIPYNSSMIDLGDAAAEQLALALDPFPRKPGAALPDDAAAAQEGAFSVLQRLRGLE